MDWMVAASSNAGIMTMPRRRVVSAGEFSRRNLPRSRGEMPSVDCIALLSATVFGQTAELKRSQMARVGRLR